MKRVLIAIGSVMLTTAAHAQYGPPPGPPRGYDAGAFWRGAPLSPYKRIDILQQRINRGIADGSLNRGEGMRANRELNGVRDWIHRMHWEDEGRLTPNQRGNVQRRLDQISSQIRWMRHDGW